MYEQEVVVTTKYGQMPSFVAAPDGPGQYPGIIFYMDAPGIREELRNMTRRIAKHGYFASCPTCITGSARCASTSSSRRRDVPVHARGDEQPDDREGHGRHRRPSRLPRRAGQGEARPGRLRRLLHERPVHHRRRGASRIASRRPPRSTASASSPTRKIRRTCSWTRSRANSITPSPRPTAASRRTSPAS